MVAKQLDGETRSAEQLQKDYEIEKELAARLRSASQKERRQLYSSLYDEWCARSPLNPVLIRKRSPDLIAKEVAGQMRFLRPFLHRESSFMEIGPGDCALSIEVASIVKDVVAVDVSRELTQGISLPDNCHLYISDGISIPVPHSSVTIAYSYSLMEHLHPDDAVEQLRNILKALVPGGTYVCITPNRLSGPHDISMYFDSVAAGFHLKEYIATELVRLCKIAGFSRCDIYLGERGFYFKTPHFLLRLVEMLLGALPRRVMSAVGQGPLRVLLRVRVAAKK